MYISKLEIEGYKNCKTKSEISFNPNLNILVGENGSGKTNIIDSLRLILKEQEFSYMNINENDFYRSFTDGNNAKKINIDLKFEGLSEDEKIIFLSWCDSNFEGLLHFESENKTNTKGRYRKIFWGGLSKASAFEEETFDFIDCIYLPPLRDAESKLTNGRNSRLATLLKHQYKTEISKDSLVKNVNEFNKSIVENSTGEYQEIEKARGDINRSLQNAMGSKFSQKINLQFSETSFNSIMQNIKMVFFPNLEDVSIDNFREIAMNSLGYNNLLYIATVFAELETNDDKDNSFKVLLIEEPEAHLHPQLQIKLIKHLEEISKSNSSFQIILTTHSPVLASSVSLEYLIHIQNDTEQTKIHSINLSEINLDQKTENYLNRWLDATKSTLFFSKGIILVEGISESLLLPTLSKIILNEYNSKEPKSQLPTSLEEAGISVINMNGIYFQYFMKLFCNFDDHNSEKIIRIKCSGITDNDPGKEIYPKINEKVKGENHIISYQEKINNGKFSKLFISPLKTFEYDLAMKDNHVIMASTLYDLWPTDGEIKKELEGYSKELKPNEDERREICKGLYNRVENSLVGKGLFSQNLAEKIQNSYKSNNNFEFNIPQYIKDAVIWVCGGENEDERA